ncbi:MAG: Ppx/GppA family phosphatase [Firmicutes bacterium]|nr:Ppx/GppA family phosphatase [Candidatus Caballimonas caccae]
MEKIAIIDLGSNTARLLIVNVNENGNFQIVDQLKEAPRLGKDMEKDGFLKPQAIQETIKTLKMFRKLCDANGVEKIIAVATAAVRHAKNQRSFLDEVSATCGLKLRVLSAEEEAVYVYRGVINTMDIPKGLILEIGGGSTKMVYYNRRNLLNYATLPFGAITLTEKFGGEGVSSEERTKKIEEFFIDQIKDIEWLKDVDPEVQLIGVGGSFRNLCRMTKIMKKYPLKAIHNYVVSDEDFDHVYDLLKSLDLDRTKKIKGLSSGRADILPSAIAVASAFKKYMNLGSVVISGSGLRTGLLFNYAVPSTIDKPISDVLTYSLNSIVDLYGCNMGHTEHLVNLSVQLFKQLRVLHKFPRQYLRILKVAAYMYNTGKRVDFYNFEKHSGYIILNSNIYGISHRDIVMASFVASNTAIEDINPFDWAKFHDLVTEEDIDAVRKMGVMLRIAYNLNRSLTSVVSGINCDILGDSVIMKTEVQGDATLEINSAISISNDFRKIFKKNLEIL